MRSLSQRYLPVAVAAVVPFQIIGVAVATTQLSAPVAASSQIVSPAAPCPAPGGRPVPAAAATGTGIVVQGHGWGHGLGMSQFGAQGAARLGCSHAQILAAYYAGTRLARRAMTAPVELTLSTTARRSTVYTETSAVTWVGAGRAVTQPARTTWTVTTTAGRVTLMSPTGTRLLQLGAGTSLQARHAGTVVRLRSFSSALSSALTTVDLRLRWGSLTFTGSGSTAAVSETLTGDARASAVDRYLWGWAKCR